MKSIFNILILIVIVLSTSCAYDNYDTPEATFSGRIVYNGEPINVMWNNVRMQLWEPGWGANLPIDVPIKQDGSFSQLLFNANYKLSFPAGNGPYRPLADTIEVVINGSREMDIEVMPYYMVRNGQFSMTGRTLSASASLDQIITDENAKNIERVYLYVNKSTFVDSRYEIAKSEVAGGDIADLGNVALSVEVPNIVPGQNYVFARIGVKIDGVNDMIFSQVERIQF